MNDIKKYLIGFIIGLSLIGTLTYAANNGSIGELFKLSNGAWVLEGKNIEDGTISIDKLTDILSGVINANTINIKTLSGKIITNTSNIFSGDYNDLINKPTIPIDTTRSDEEINALIDKRGITNGYFSSTFHACSSSKTCYLLEEDKAWHDIKGNISKTQNGIWKSLDNKYLGKHYNAWFDTEDEAEKIYHYEHGAYTTLEHRRYSDNFFWTRKRVYDCFCGWMSYRSAYGWYKVRNYDSGTPRKYCNDCNGGN